MVSKEHQIRNLLRWRVKRLMMLSELVVPERQFAQFRQLVLDELGGSGFLKDVGRVFRGKAQSGD